MTDTARLELEEEKARLEREDWNIQMKDSWRDSDRQRMREIANRIAAINEELKKEEKK